MQPVGDLSLHHQPVRALKEFILGTREPDVISIGRNVESSL